MNARRRCHFKKFDFVFLRPVNFDLSILSFVSGLFCKFVYNFSIFASQHRAQDFFNLVMESKVTILAPNGRRQVIKVTPNTTLLEVLETLCSKHNFNSEDYTLTFHNKEISLSQPFRFSGLPNNCQLEMSQTNKKRSVADVDICVQLEDGSRKQGRFQSTVNLLDVLKQVASDELAKYESPVVVYMRQTIVGTENIASTTLKSLGILEGKALLRLTNKKEEELKTQAMVYTPPVPKAEKKNDENDDEKPKSSKVGGGGGFAITKDLFKSLKKSAEAEENKSKSNEDKSTSGDSINKEEESEKPKYDWGDAPGRSMQTPKGSKSENEEDMSSCFEVEPEYHVIGERNALIYSMDAAQTQIEDLPDSFYDLTVNDLKLVLRDLRKIASGDEDAPLLTEKLREIENNNIMLKKISQYKNCVIRIQFPDRHVLQGMFKPIDTICDVMEFIKPFLNNPEQPSYLFTIPPKTKLDPNKTLLELDFVPNALVHFSHDDESLSGPLIKDEFLAQLTTPDGALYAATKFRKEQKHSAEARPQLSPSTGAIPKRPRPDEA
ncbi:tether containing UBX domain for GLUT4 [Haematobia irritans]|uniref:tether containing UBX domain for GLUT4 n=1 Tax=Haematobia irritans TaxID=7368 RepID=UPI003F501B93